MEGFVIYFAAVQAGAGAGQRMLGGGQCVLGGKRQVFASVLKSLATQMFGFLLYFSLLCVRAPIYHNTEAELQHQNQQTRSQKARLVCASARSTMPRCTANASTRVAKGGVVILLKGLFYLNNCRQFLISLQRRKTFLY